MILLDVRPRALNVLNGWQRDLLRSIRLNRLMARQSDIVRCNLTSTIWIYRSKVLGGTWCRRRDFAGLT